MSIPSFETHCSIDSVYAFSAAAASLAAFRSRASPGLPFCGNFVSPCSLSTQMLRQPTCHLTKRISDSPRRSAMMRLSSFKLRRMVRAAMPR